MWDNKIKKPWESYKLMHLLLNKNKGEFIVLSIEIFKIFKWGLLDLPFSNLKIIVDYQ
jgi:hypothetical protein